MRRRQGGTGRASGPTGWRARSPQSPPAAAGPRPPDGQPAHVSRDPQPPPSPTARARLDPETRPIGVPAIEPLTCWDPPCSPVPRPGVPSTPRPPPGQERPRMGVGVSAEAGVPSRAQRCPPHSSTAAEGLQRPGPTWPRGSTRGQRGGLRPGLSQMNRRGLASQPAPRSPLALGWACRAEAPPPRPRSCGSQGAGEAF